MGYQTHPGELAAAGAARARTVSIVVPCRNERAHIGPLLESLARQRTAGFALEIIVADGMSDDGTREILAAFAHRLPALRVIDNPERFTSTALNRAIRAATGEIVLRMDAHTEYAEDYVATCVAILDQTHADNVGGPARTRAEGRAQRAIAAAYHSRFACGGAAFHDAEREGEVDTVPYGCWRRDLFERVGLFDEQLLRNQDDEFNLRLRRAGGAIWQSPRIRSWYRPRSSVRALFRQYFQYGFWKVAVIRKHRLPASWRHLVPGAFVLGLMLLALATVLAALLTLPGAWMPALLLAAAGGLYMAGCSMAAVLAARGSGWDLLPVLPLVFATYHSAYGLGFLAGLLYWPFKAGGAEPVRAFSELTR